MSQLLFVRSFLDWRDWSVDMSHFVKNLGGLISFWKKKGAWSQITSVIETVHFFSFLTCHLHHMNHIYSIESQLDSSIQFVGIKILHLLILVKMDLSHFAVKPFKCITVHVSLKTQTLIIVIQQVTCSLISMHVRHNELHRDKEASFIYDYMYCSKFLSRLLKFLGREWSDKESLITWMERAIVTFVTLRLTTVSFSCRRTWPTRM